METGPDIAEGSERGFYSYSRFYCGNDSFLAQVRGPSQACAEGAVVEGAPAPVLAPLILPRVASYPQ